MGSYSGNPNAHPDPGIPLKHYVDSIRVFRFVQNCDSFWRKQFLEMDDVDTQWKEVLDELSIAEFHYLTSQLKSPVFCSEIKSIFANPDPER